MPVAGGPKITKTGILLEVDAANASSYSSGSSTFINVFRPGTFNGTINGTLGFNPDDSKGALTFPGTASSYIDFGNIGDQSSVWSFQVAVKPAPSASGNYTILSYASGSDTGSITYKLDYSSSNQSAVLSAYSATGSAQIIHQITGSVPTGSWSIINASYGISVLGMYVNGRPTDYAVTTGSTVGYSANNKLYLGGTYGTTSSFYTGSVASFFSYNSDVPNTQLVQNYNAYATRFGLPPSTLFPSSVDPDAFRFIEVAQITDQTQITAVNNLVVGLKGAGLWTKMQAIYPFVGGTAYSHKWNLKDPRDADSSFRLQYFGTILHSSNGANQGGTGYIQTYFTPSNIIPPSSSFHYSLYTLTSGGTQFNTAVENNGSSMNNITYDINYFGSPRFSLFQSVQSVSTPGAGYSIISRLDTTKSTLYRYWTSGDFINDNTNAFSNTATTYNGTIAFISNRGYAAYTGPISFASLGAGLTANEASSLNTLVRNFNITLSRNVV